MSTNSQTAEEKIQQLLEVFQKNYTSLQQEWSIEKFKDDVKEELKLDEFNLQEEAMNNTEKHHEYVVRYFQCKNLKSTYLRYEKVLYKLLYDYYKYESPEGPFRTKEDYHRNIFAHESWVFLKKIQDHLDDVTDYLSRVDGLFGERNFSIGAVSRLLGH